MFFNSELKNKIKNKEIFYKRNFIDKNKLNDIFCRKDLENLLNLRPFVNYKRFHIMTKEEFNWIVNTWASDENSYPPSLIDNKIKSHLCFLTDCSRVTKEINDIAGELESITDSPTDAHIFFSFTGDKQGFGIHSDDSHNFILQIEGKTKFKVWDIKDTEVKRNIDNLDKLPFIDVIMEPGDCIFIPAFFWHMAESCTKRMSISFPISLNNDSIKEDRNWIRLPH